MFFNAVIFDLDNTIYDYDICHSKALDKVANTLKCESSDFRKKYKEATIQAKNELGNTASSHNRFIYFKILSEHFNVSPEELNYVYCTEYFKNIKPFKGVIELIKFFKETNIKLCLLTDFLTEYQYKKLRILGLSDYFDVIVTSEELGIEKPSIRSFQYCLNKLNEPANKVLMIGDSIEKDIIGAKKCGIYPFYFFKPVWLASLSVMFEKNRASFSSYTELLSFFKDIKKDINDLSELSRYFGERFDLTQAAGGNISVKNDKLMMIKSSGYCLSDVSNKNGYTIVNNNTYNNIGLKDDVLNGEYNDINNYNVVSDIKASMETYMHSYLDKYVVHLHPIQVNKILIKKDAKEIIKKLFPDSIFLDYVTPGVELSKKLLEELQPSFKETKVIFLANHGIIISTDIYKNVISTLETILYKCENYLGINYNKYKFTNNISRILSYYFDGRKKYVSYLSEDNIITSYLNNFDFKSVFPDKVIYCGMNILNLNDYTDEDDLEYMNTTITPSIIISDKNIYIVSSTLSKCREIETVLKSHLLVVENENINYLDIDEECKLLGMDEEKYRQNIN